MRQEQGIESLIQHQNRLLSASVLSQLLLEDLQHCSCRIYGKTTQEVPVLLAELNLITDSLYYDKFDQRIDFTLTGDIINTEFVPLIYSVDGQCFSLKGRCSMIRRVCGVDLYLNSSYTAKLGDRVRQSFSISVKDLLKKAIKQQAGSDFSN